MFRRLARSLQARNPFYLLSAVSMLTGCFALSQTVGLSPGQWKPLVALMGVLQLYELVLLGLAIYLFRRVEMPGDARTAFLLGLLFLADTTYLNTELATSDPWAAPWVALAYLAFLVPKLFLLRSTLGLTSLRTLTLIVAQIGVLVYIPGTFSAVHFMDAKVHALGLGREMLPLIVYGLWWLVGAIPLVLLWADRSVEHGEHPVARVVSRASLFVPFASILLHLCSLHWMYSLPVYSAYLTPLMLGIGANVAYTVTREASAWRSGIQWGTPALALLLSTSSAEALQFTIGDAFLVSPIRIALVGIALVYWKHRCASGQRAFAWASTLALSFAASGHSFPAMQRTWTGLVPETYAEYGLAAMVAAFALLFLALAVSLRRIQDVDAGLQADGLRSNRGARYGG